MCIYQFCYIPMDYCLAEGMGLEPITGINRYLFSRQAPRPAGHLPFLSLFLFFDLYVGNRISQLPHTNRKFSSLWSNALPFIWSITNGIGFYFANILSPFCLGPASGLEPEFSPYRGGALPLCYTGLITYSKSDFFHILWKFGYINLIYI